MTKQQSAGMAALAVAVAALAALAAGLGVFARGDGSFETVTSVRGITYDMATNGVYAYNSRQVVAEGVGWDVFSLVVAAPVMLVAAYLVARGSLRGRLLALGLFGYFLYQYLEYAMTWALGPLFPLFIILIVLSVAGLVWFGVNVAQAGVADRFAGEFPHRLFVGLNVSMAVLLTLMWSGRIAAGLTGDLAGAGLEGETTLVVQALDLGFVVPMALLFAYLVWRRSTAGYALAAVYVVMAMAMSAAIVSMLLSAGMYTGEFAIPPIVVFGLFVAGFAAAAVRIYAGYAPHARRQARPAPAARPVGA